MYSSWAIGICRKVQNCQGANGRGISHSWFIFKPLLRSISFLGGAEGALGGTSKENYIVAFNVWEKQVGSKAGQNHYLHLNPPVIQIIHITNWNKLKAHPSAETWGERWVSEGHGQTLHTHFEISYNRFPFIISSKCEINHAGKSEATGLQHRAAVPRSDTRRCVCT